MIRSKFSSVRLIAYSLLLMAFFSSCRKEALDIQSPNNRPCHTYVEQFEAVWEGIEHSYVLWSRDTVDWEARYDKYKPIFESFDANGVDYNTYRDTWAAFTDGFLDHHMAIILWNPVYKAKSVYFPAHNDYKHATNDTVQLEILKNLPGVTEFVSYRDKDSKYITSAFCLIPGKTADKKIAYFRFSGFSVSDLRAAGVPREATAPFRAFYGSNDTAWYNGITDGAANRADVESIIIDLRGNGGGNSDEITPLICSMIQGHFHWGYSRYKQGLGRLDYTGWVPLQFPCPENHLATPKPVVVLTDINSVSCSELSTYIIKSMPFGTVIGERTYGGTCALVPMTDFAFDYFYSGCFGDQRLYENKTLADSSLFTYYVYSGTYDVVNTEYESFEGKGIQPDIEVLYNKDELNAGVDSQLNRALQFLRTGK